jgi:glycosyltransferase involved in cell wall biosynthesis
MREPRILMILEAGDFFPSGILRGRIYVEALENAGFRVTVRNRTCAPVLWARQRLADRIGKLTGWTPRMRFVDAALVILAKLNEPLLALQSRRHDLVYTSKLLSYSLMRKLRRPIVYDFGDAVWLDPTVKRFDEMLVLADEVTTDNEITATHVRALNSHCTVIPDASQVELFDRRRAFVSRPANRVIIGWIGTPKSAVNLEILRPALERIGRRYPQVELRLLGVGPDFRLFDGIKTTVYRTYDQSMMVDEVLRMHVGLFPLTDTEQSATRGITKAAIYMAGGAVVVASPVGEVPRFIENDVTGILAGADWEEHLSRLIEDEGLRRSISAAALQKVRRELPLSRSVDKLIDVFRRYV